MATPILQPAFSAGELSPGLFGRVDLAKYHLAASTMRNMFANYRGGAASRPGTALVGRSKTVGTSLPPRVITFQFSLTQGYALEFGNLYFRVISNGAYVTEASINITGITRANPAVVTAANTYTNGDWVFITGVGGMTQVNGKFFIVAGRTAGNFQLHDLDGNNVDSTNYTAYTAGGTAARVLTVTTPYVIADVPALKFAQSADVMSVTHPSYAPRDITRVSATSWTLTTTTFAASIAAPTGVSSSASATQVTISNITQANPGIVTVSQNNFVNNSLVYINNVVGMTEVNGRVFEAFYVSPTTFQLRDVNGSNVDTTGFTPYSSGGIAVQTAGGPVGIPTFQYCVTALTAAPAEESVASSIVTVTNSVDITTQAGTIKITWNAVTGAESYNVYRAPIAYNTTVPTGVVFGYVGSATSTSFIDSNIVPDFTFAPPTHDNPFTGANAWPSVVGYFQQRRVYANTNNQPDTYFMSKPGAFVNFDVAFPTRDDDAITGTPWAQQVNGIQFMVPMPGGLVVLTGLGAWQVNGGSQHDAITPASQVATPQAYNGCHDHVPPLTINYDILYIQSKGSIPRDLAYNFFTNIYTGSDLSILSSHLFQEHQIVAWAWCEEPWKLAWAVRDDGILLSLTYLKEQDIYAWARHDTNGEFYSVCSVTEPPVDAAYFIVRRLVEGQYNYFIERMDDRLWASVEDSWCVDCGLQYPMTFPNATLTPAAANGTANISSVNVIAGGSGYTAPTVTLTDSTGTGATFSVTVSGGSITSITPLTEGSGYTHPTLTINDTTGSGAVAQAVITNIVQFSASAGVFTSASVGDVIRAGGGVATITEYTSATVVQANITTPIAYTRADDPNDTPIPLTSGNWSQTTPTMTVTNLDHLEGMWVTGLADGSVIDPQVVVDGEITLPQPASAIIIGLGFQCQLQTPYLDVPGQTVAGRRKLVTAGTIRVENSRGIEVGCNQVDVSTLPNGLFQGSIAAEWEDMTQIAQRNNAVGAGTALPLFTGDWRQITKGTWAKPGQVAVQQRFPLPANILSCIGEYEIGDTPG